MKLNNLSRLTALLLAIVLFLSSIVYAEGLDSSTVTDYESALQGAQASAGTYCTNEYCDELYTALQYTDMTARYNYLKSLESTTVTDTTEEGDTIESTLTYWVLMHYYWICYATTDTAHNFTGDELCNCYIEHETDTVDGILYPYGSSSHAEDCPWYGNARTLTDEATCITVTGVIPEGVVLVVTKITSIDTSTIDGYDNSHFDKDAHAGTPTLVGYDIKLMYPADYEVDTTLAGTEWQPTGEVYVTIPNTWDGDMSYPAPVVDVYHVHGEITELLTSRNDTVDLYDDGSIGYTVTSFSEHYVESGESSVTITPSFDSGGGPNQNITEMGTAEIVYVKAGVAASFTVTIADSDVTLIPGADNDSDIKATESQGSSYALTVSSAATSSVGDEAVYTLTYSATSNRKEVDYIATIKVIVVDETVFNQQTYLNNTLTHIQIDNTVSTNVTYTDSDGKEHTLTTYDFNFNYSDYDITVNDDGSVTLSCIDTTTNQPLSITYEVYTPVGVKYPVSIDYLQPAIGNANEKESQISANGTFFAGTSDNPVWYRVTVKATLQDGKTEITLIKDLHYWHDDNDCPGSGTSVGRNSGIDISDMGGTAAAGMGTIYIKKLIGNNGTLPANATFEFEVYQGSTLFTTLELDMKQGADNGTVTYSVPYGYTYSVQEVASSAEIQGYDVTTTITPDSITTSSSSADGTFTVTNTYTASTGSLTIVKDGTVNSGDTFIFNVTGTDENTSGINMNVVIPGTGSITINDLPAGAYKITEDESWAWRYNCTVGDVDTNEATATISATSQNPTVTFTNTVDNPSWLDGSAYADNAFTDSGVTRVD